jgi:hypothetical protein
MIEEIKLTVSASKLASIIELIVNSKMLGRDELITDMSIWGVDFPDSVQQDVNCGACGSPETLQVLLPAPVALPAAPVISDADESLSDRVNEKVSLTADVAVESGTMDFSTAPVARAVSHPSLSMHAQEGTDSEAVNSMSPAEFSPHAPSIGGSDRSASAISRTSSNNTQNDDRPFQDTGDSVVNAVSASEREHPSRACDQASNSTLRIDSNEADLFLDRTVPFLAPDSVTSQPLNSNDLGAVSGESSMASSVKDVVGHAGIFGLDVHKNGTFSSVSTDDGDSAWITSLLDMQDVELDQQLEKIEKDTRVSRKTFDIRIQKLKTIQVAYCTAKGTFSNERINRSS